jgi:hypothetical protein
LVRGYKYIFNIDAVGFPFAIKSAKSPGLADLWNDILTNNVEDYGTIEFTVPPWAPNNLYYTCPVDPDMGGNIYIVNTPPPTTTTVGPLVDFTISSSCDAVNSGTITMDNFIGGSGSYQIGMITGLTGWFTNQFDSEHPDYWSTISGSFSRNGLPNGTYWMTLRDNLNPTVFISKSITLTC